MTRSEASPRIAVLDIGKTNLKLLMASEDGWPLETHSIYDLAGLEEWFLDTLAMRLGGRDRVGVAICDDWALLRGSGARHLLS